MIFILPQLVASPSLFRASARAFTGARELQGSLHYTHRSPPPVCKAPSERLRLGRYLRQLPNQQYLDGDAAGGPPVDEWNGCARCLCLLDEIRAEGLPVPADANNAVMRACASRIDVVQALFDSLAVEGTETEASFAALMNARLECGDLEGATAAQKSHSQVASTIMD